MDEHAKRCIGRLLERLAGVRGRQLYSTYAVRLPRGFWTWEAEGVRLVTLAALAPHHARGLLRRPAWQSLNGKRPPVPRALVKTAKEVQNPAIERDSPDSTRK